MIQSKNLLKIRDDLEVECYYVEYESLIEQGKFCTRSQAYLTLNEAIAGEEKILNQKIMLKTKIWRSNDNRRRDF